MTTSRVWSRKVLPLSQCSLLAVAIGSTAVCAYSQAAPPDDTRPESSLQQASMSPVQSQLAETPNLNSLNENADTVKYSDNATTRGPVFFSIEATGTATNNLQQTFDNQPSTTGGYLTLGVPLGIHLWTPVTDFAAYLRYDSSFYPGNSDLNHSSEIYSQQLTHQISDTTTTSWSLAGGHIVTLGHYLSPVIGVGTTGVLAPQEASGLQPLTDAATTYSISHQTSERDSWTAAGTAGWLDQPVLGANTGTVTAYRQVTGGADAQWQHALNSREIAGVEVTNVYIEGISPSGTSNFSSAKLTFGQTLTPHSSVTAGIGPLYTRSDLTGQPSSTDFTYAANVAFQYRRPSGGITGGFSRVYELGYIAPASVANELYFNFDRPLTSKIVLTAASQFAASDAFKGRNNYSQFVFTTRLDAYLTHSLDYHVEGSSFIQDTGSNTPGYNDNEIASGITFYFGNPLSREGVR